MITRQISVFAENKPGSLAKVTAILSKENINIRASTIATSDTFGVLNLIVDDPHRAFEALTKEGVMATLKEVVAVAIRDLPGGLNKLTQCLFKERININNAYGFVLENMKTAVFIVDVDQREKTEEILKINNFKILDEQALSSSEPIFNETD
jgi:hypothetical protein